MDRQPGLFGVQIELGDPPLIQRRDMADAADRQFIRAIAAVNQPGPFRSQHAKRLGHRAQQGPRKGPGQLPPDPGGVGQGTQDVEDGAGAQLGPDRADMAHGGVVHRGHHETDAGGLQRLFNQFRADHHVDPQFGQHVRRPGFGTEVAVAMFGDHDARPRHHKGGGGRNVQRALGVTAGADDIHRAIGRGHPVAARPHHRGGSGIFIDGFAPCAQRHQQPAGLGGGGITGKQDVERLFGLGPGQGAAAGCGDQRFQRLAHAGTEAKVRKLRKSAWPCSLAMDSG